MDGERIGTTIAGFRIDAIVGEGGMGVVYRARQERLDRDVAIKVIAPELARDAGFRERFIRESRSAAAIEHPSVVPIYHSGEDDDGTLFLAMRFISGIDLSAMIRRDGKLEPGRAVAILGQVADALDEAHSKGLVHRDVKPANVLIAEGRSGLRAYLTDFGLTKRVSSEGGLTKTGQWLGTVDYAAPEQIQGERMDARSDVYSLGCVAYEMLTGQIPFQRPTEMARLWAHVNDSPPLLHDQAPQIPAGIDEAVARAMAKSPADRYSSAGDFGRSLKAALEGESAPRTERTVAIGAAAPTLSDPDTAATAIDRPAASEAATAAQPPAPAPRRGGGGAAPGGGAPDRRGRRRAAIAAVTVLALAGAGAAVVATGVLSDDEEPGVRDRGERRATTTTDPGPEPVSFTSLATRAYTVEVPEGWSVLARDEPAGDPTGSFFHSELTSPDGTMRMVIDRNPGSNEDPGGAAREVEAAVSGRGNYVLHALEPTTADGVGAHELDFSTTEDGERLRKVDFFFVAGEDNVAVLVEGPDDPDAGARSREIVTNAVGSYSPVPYRECADVAIVPQSDFGYFEVGARGFNCATADTILREFADDRRSSLPPGPDGFFCKEVEAFAPGNGRWICTGEDGEFTFVTPL